jgi:N-acetylneuraminate synthase
MKNVIIGDTTIGVGSSVYIVAEIGINHNGDFEIAKQLIEIASKSGANAVKLQKRTPLLCVPIEQRNLIRDTPWGRITYLEYRERMEFTKQQYKDLSDFAAIRKLDFFASAWDVESVRFLKELNHKVIKVASACITDLELLEEIRLTSLPVILSTGMSTMEQITEAVKALGDSQKIICHTTSTYPCKPEELNLKMITTLDSLFDYPIGYSGHEVGLSTTVAAVALGAKFIERHLTLDRTMWGSDQSASIEPLGFSRLVSQIRTIESALGDGIKKVYESEAPFMQKLRKHH